MKDTVILEQGTLARITINRPESLNALNREVLQGLSQCLERLAVDDAVRVVVLQGSGEKAFVAGADISAMRAMKSDEIASYMSEGQAVMRQLESFPVPVLAAIDGFALGGGLELALAADIIIASASAKLGLPEVTLGLIPGFGGTQRLLRRCGQGFARRLIFSGEMVDASEAQTAGLVDEVVEPSAFAVRVTELAGGIAKRGPLALRAAKRAMAAFDRTQLASGLRREGDEFLGVFASRDAHEGLTAFLEKRKPDFLGE